MVKLQTLVLALVALTGATGCMDWWPELGLPAGKKPWAEWNPVQDMIDTPAIQDQEMRQENTPQATPGLRYPPPRTVDVHAHPYPFAPSDVEAADALVNPVAMTEDNLRYGKLEYETTCIVCHGPHGEGNGFIVPKFPQPPPLTSARVRGWSDGHIFHIISNGTGRMWSYKNQLKPMERWAVINYVRTLQRAKYPEPRDLERVTD